MHVWEKLIVYLHLPDKKNRKLSAGTYFMHGWYACVVHGSYSMGPCPGLSLLDLSISQKSKEMFAEHPLVRKSSKVVE